MLRRNWDRVWAAWQDNSEVSESCRAESYGHIIRPCMADRHPQSPAISHNTRKRKWQGLGPGPAELRVSGRKLLETLKLIIHNLKWSDKTCLFSSCCASQQLLFSGGRPHMCSGHDSCGWSTKSNPVTAVYRWLYIWDDGQGAASAKYKKVEQIRCSRWASPSRRRLPLDSDVTTDLWCIYRAGLISTTFFPLAHTQAVVKRALQVKE